MIRPSTLTALVAFPFVLTSLGLPPLALAADVPAPVQNPLVARSAHLAASHDVDVYEVEPPTPAADLRESRLGCGPPLQRITPVFEHGAPVGFKVIIVRPESTLPQLGIENGDVVTRVNGIELHSSEDVLTVYSRVRDARVIFVDLKRRGRPHHNVYLVR